MSTGPRWVKSLEKLGAVLEVYHGTLREYGAQGCPCTIEDKDPERGYNVAAVRRWMKQHGRIRRKTSRPAVYDDAQGAAGPDTHQRIREANATAAHAKARLQEIALAEREGQIITIAALRERHLYLRNELLSMARSLAPRLEGKPAMEILGIMEDAFNDMLSRFGGEDE